MRQVPVDEAVGMVLCHDITRIVPGGFKGPAFRKGQRVRAEDIPLLKDMGKQHLYVFELREGWIHEDDAARRIARAAAGPGITLSEPSEGRVNLVAEEPGLLKVDVAALSRINSVEEVVFSTLHTNQPVSAGRPVAGTRIIPLVTREANIAEVEQICLEVAACDISSSVPPAFGWHCDDRLRSVLRENQGSFRACAQGPNFPNWAARLSDRYWSPMTSKIPLPLFVDSSPRAQAS